MARRQWLGVKVRGLADPGPDVRPADTGDRSGASTGPGSLPGRVGASLRLKLLGLTAAAVALALGTAALLTGLQTRRAFDRFVAEGDAAEAKRMGDIVTFVYRQGGGLPAALPLVRHLDEAQGLRLELKVSGHGSLLGGEPLPTALAAAAAGHLDPAALERLLPPGAHLEIAPAGATPAHGAPALLWGWSALDVVTATMEGEAARPDGDGGADGAAVAGAPALAPAADVLVLPRPSPAAGLTAPGHTGWAAPLGSGASLMLMEPEAGFLGSFRHALVAAALLAGGLALALGAGMAGRLLGPVEALTAAARRLEAGDLGQRVAVRSEDEIGQLAQAFNAMASSLERQQALRRNLVSDVAHELRTPLANLSGYLEALRDGVLEPTAEQLASLHEEAQLLGRLVDDLQVLAQAEAGEQRLAPRPTPVEPLLRQSMDAFQAQAAAKDQVLQAELADGLGVCLLDPDRVAQILRNLLANALTHAPSGGRIGLEALREEDAASAWLRIVVTDDGPGIAPEDQDRIFERFYRVDPSRSRDTGGSGLGLTIARQLAVAQGGSLTVDSRPGQGARFTLRLPFVPGAGS